jgi:hypothetical protein
VKLCQNKRVMHLEIALMREIPEIKVKEWFLSIDYAPVRFRTQNVQVWLPQSVDSYEDVAVRRSIISHKFPNFLLFSVQTDELIGNPQKITEVDGDLVRTELVRLPMARLHWADSP